MLDVRLDHQYSLQELQKYPEGMCFVHKYEGYVKL